MKSLNRSFPYIFALLFCILSWGQQPIDSTSYYYNAVVYTKDFEKIIHAFDYFERESARHLRKGDTLSATYDLELLALGKYKMGFRNESEAHAIEAYKLLDHIDNDSLTLDSKKRLSNHLGMIYRSNKDYDNALLFYSKALKLNQQPEHKISIANNIANIYTDQHKYKKAVAQLYGLYDKILALENSNIKATAIDNLGYNQAKLNIPDGKKNMETALEIRLANNDLIGLFTGYQHWADYYLDRNEKNKALEYANKANRLAKKIDNPDYKLEALALLIKSEGNSRLQQYQKLNDSINRTRQSEQNNYAAVKYNVEKERRNTNAARLEKEKQKRQKLLYLGIGAFILCCAVFLYFILKSRHKKEKIIQVHNTENRISKKVHDEVANDLYHLMAKIQGDITVKEELLDDLEKVYNKTRDISKENNAIELQENFSEQLSDLLLSYQNEKVNIATRNISKVEWNDISEIKKTILYRVLQELMTNMRKHSDASIVVIAFQQNKKNITIEYTDNGKGCELKNKNGLQNTESRIHAIKGTIIFESQIDKGFKAKIIV